MLSVMQSGKESVEKVLPPIKWTVCSMCSMCDSVLCVSADSRDRQ